MAHIFTPFIDILQQCHHPISCGNGAKGAILHLEVTSTLKYGRDNETWAKLTEAGLEFLIERARLKRTTSYTELNTVLEQRTGLPGFDFERSDERAATGHLLGEIVKVNHPESNLMISALVIYLNGNDAGTDFYNLAADLGLLPRKHRPSRRRSSG